MGKREISTSGIIVERAITILRPPADLYRFCRKMENFPRFMGAIEAVQQHDGRALWRAVWTAGKHLEWETEIFEDRPDELIAWGAVESSELVASGSLRFHPVPAALGTEVHLAFRFDLPSSTLADLRAKIFGEDPVRQIHQDLRRLKQLMETGEVATIEGQPRGKG